MDALSTVIETLQLKGQVYFRTLFHGPWAVEVEAFQQAIRFHYVILGGCYVKVDGEADIRQVKQGEIILIPHGRSHVMADQPSHHAMPLAAALELSGFQGDGIFELGEDKSQPDTVLICGYFGFDATPGHPLIAQLPASMVIDQAQVLDYSWLSDALKILAYETRQQRTGSDAVIRRLVEVIFLLALRAWSESDRNRQTFLSAIADPQLGRSLKALHQHPEKNWTVDRLAKEAGLSRTAYAERFRQYTAITPMQYATHWRMRIACAQMASSKASVEQIAENIGYQSVAAFSRVFKKVIGMSPGEYRRQRSMET